MDLIDRQAAIEILATMQGQCTSKAALVQNSKIWQQIKDMPSAEPEKPYVIKTHRFIKADERERLEKELCRKLSQQNLILLDPDMELVYPVRKGKWVKENVVLTSNPPQYQWHCSECGKIMHGFSAEVLTDYCSSCGADMRGEEDEPDKQTD